MHSKWQRLAIDRPVHDFNANRVHFLVGIEHTHPFIHVHIEINKSAGGNVQMMFDQNVYTPFRNVYA